MKKILIISMFVLIAAVNVAVITNKNDGFELSLNSLLKVAMADGEWTYTPPSLTEPKDQTKIGYWFDCDIVNETICIPSGNVC